MYQTQQRSVNAPVMNWPVLLSMLPAFSSTKHHIHYKPLVNCPTEDDEDNKLVQWTACQLAVRRYCTSLFQYYSKYYMYCSKATTACISFRRCTWIQFEGSNEQKYEKVALNPGSPFRILSRSSSSKAARQNPEWRVWVRG